ncbi:MAG TPA: peptidoglycan DD-metalloendopeptidase family protein [Alphaproteobacteria bacterium]|nr:peptidoglycan DD-metalloendopeptidase family protein [Alphaproteobacteria bacterium]
MRAAQLSRRALVVLASGIVAGLLVSIWLGEVAAQHVMKVDPPGGLAEADARAKAALAGERWWRHLNDNQLAILLPTVSLPPQLSDQAEHAAHPSKQAARLTLPSDRNERPSHLMDKLDMLVLPFHRYGNAAHAADPITHGARAAEPVELVSFAPFDPSPPALAHGTGAPIERSVLIGKGDTLNDILLRQGVPASEAHDAAAAMRSMLDLRTLKPGVEIKLTFEPDTKGRLDKVSLPMSPDQTVSVERNGNDEFSASKIAQPLTRQLVRTEGVIRSSLYEDAVAAGIPAPLLAELIHAFSYDVDFQREIQPGDRFELAYEQFTNGGGQVAKTGNIVYAALTLSGQVLKIYRFEARKGFVDYFNAKGESVRKALLRTPIDGARISSGYGMRLHPILGYTTMHKGVDFAAATGTPIMAAGDGVVELAGWRGNYGIYLRLAHNSEYGTAYAHMSAIARGIRVGERVRQGQVIGYVGATGLATGPHLYYEVLVHERQINPLSVKLPTGVKLAGTELKSFIASKAGTDAALASLPQATKLAKKAF